MEKRKHDSSQTEYPYNFVAPYDLENCCLLITSANGKKQRKTRFKPYDSKIHTRLTPSDVNVYSFQVRMKEISRHPVTVGAEGKLQYWEPNETLVSFRVKYIVRWTQILFFIMFLVFGTIAFISAMVEGYLEGIVFVAFWLFLVILMPLYAYQTLRNGGIRLVRGIFRIAPESLKEEDKYLYFEQEL